MSIALSPRSIDFFNNPDAELSSPVMIFPLTIIRVMTAGITSTTCRGGNIPMANGINIEAKADKDATQATVLALSTPILIASVFLPTSPSISSTSLIISLDMM